MTSDYNDDRYKIKNILLYVGFVSNPHEFSCDLSETDLNRGQHGQTGCISTD